MAAPVPVVERLAYSPSEFAEAFGCTRQHVQNLIARGELPSIKLGRKRLIPHHAVESILGIPDRHDPVEGGADHASSP